MDLFKKHCYVIALGMLLASCGDETKTGKTVTEDSSTVVSAAVAPGAITDPANTATGVPADAAPDPALVGTVSFLIKIKGEESGQTKSDISVKTKNKTTFIAEIDGPAEKIAKEEYAEKKIPANALDACGAYWADQGNYYYVVPAEKGLRVFTCPNDGGKDWNWTMFKALDQ